MDDFFLFLSDVLELMTSPKAERRKLVVIVVALLAIAITVGIAVRFYLY